MLRRNIHLLYHLTSVFFIREVKLLLIALGVFFSLLSGFLPILESKNSLEIRRQMVLGSTTKKTKIIKTEKDFLLRQVSIGSAQATPTPTLPPKIKESEVARDDSWGKATQIDEHTWTMKLQNDSKMSPPSEILSALNSYRQKKGRSSLSWDEGLARYAKERASYFASSGSLDGHAGFKQFMDNDGFGKVGFNALGENSSFGYVLDGVHLIEWVYAGDSPHDNNQLSEQWSHVGIGVTNTATDLIFGGRKR